MFIDTPVVVTLYVFIHCKKTIFIEKFTVASDEHIFAHTTDKLFSSGLLGFGSLAFSLLDRSRRKGRVEVIRLLLVNELHFATHRSLK